jgi:hypothetical protein
MPVSQEIAYSRGTTNQKNITKIASEELERKVGRGLL